MPAAAPPLTLSALLTAHEQALHGLRSPTLDTHRGSGYDLVGGASALLWTRQANRDRQLFRNAYTDSATGPDLSRHVEAKYGGLPRILATRGAGTLTLARPAAALADGTLYAGSRVEVLTATAAVPYRITVDTPVLASDLAVAVPIEATREGAGSKATADANRLRLADTLFDATLAPVALVCADGTDEEPAGDYVARARLARREARVGYPDRIRKACLDAGAAEVELLSATSLGAAADKGLSYCYVADAAFQTSDALRKACTLALDAVRVAGCDLQVLGMQQVAVTATVAVTLWDEAGAFDVLDLEQAIVAALVDDFARRQAFWAFRLDALGGVVQRLSSAVQTAIVTTAPGEPAVAFPSVLPRYVLAPGGISLTITGPS